MLCTLYVFVAKLLEKYIKSSDVRFLIFRFANDCDIENPLLTVLLLLAID